MPDSEINHQHKTIIFAIQSLLHSYRAAVSIFSNYFVTNVYQSKQGLDGQEMESYPVNKTHSALRLFLGSFADANAVPGELTFEVICRKRRHTQRKEQLKFDKIEHFSILIQLHIHL